MNKPPRSTQEELEAEIQSATDEIDTIAANSIDKLNEIVSLKNTATGTYTNVTRRQVYDYAMTMANNSLIADALGIDKNTLADRFKRELKMGRAFARLKLQTSFYKRAVWGNNPAERIFALKNWMNYTDTGATEAIDEVDEGVEFVVRAPARPITPVQDEQAFIEDNDEEA